MTRTDALNRFHVHMHVADLDANIGFYTQLFGTPPTVRKRDYAKWLLEDPRVNFAISTGKAGESAIAHLGLQAGDADALAAIGARLQAADSVALAESGTTCCYARSDKFWAEDPQGVRWEAFHTHGEATSYYAPGADVLLIVAAALRHRKSSMLQPNRGHGPAMPAPLSQAAAEATERGVSPSPQSICFR
jgi:catechol 2,3-dioxygenase-like lactoylglutathione lyase family enzyme